MAKKKTENIKAAPVLRSGGGEQPAPTPEQTGTRTYQIMDPWKDRDVVNLVDVKAVDGEITEVKVNGEPAGGGGGGTTITTPNITISDPSEEGISMIGLWLTPDGGSYIGSLATDDQNANNFKPVLLNGKGIYYYNSNTLPSSHNQYVEFIKAGEHRKYYMIISGQATITI